MFICILDFSNSNYLTIVIIYILFIWYIVVITLTFVIMIVNEMKKYTNEINKIECEHLIPTGPSLVTASLHVYVKLYTPSKRTLKLSIETYRL